MVADQQPNERSERTVVERRDPLIGQVFDRRFRIDARIAAGGFGAIYRASHVKSGHQLALKVLHPNLASNAGVVARFRREGAALTRLRDPHTITAYELGEAPDGTLYIVMELLNGESLYERFRRHGAIPWNKVVVIARDVCSSLIEAHTLGIVHRDLKPTNIHLEPHGPDGELVKVLDFGIAKILHDSEMDHTELTNAGQMVGTLDYMSPEQMVGGPCDATSDLYTLGVVMYEMITGRRPYDHANHAAAALATILTTQPVRLGVEALVPPDVDRVVMRCLEHQPNARFASATELAAALDEILASGEEAVTTLDLAHARGGMTTIKGMRRPSRPPTAAPGAAPDAAASGAGADPSPRVIVAPGLDASARHAAAAEPAPAAAGSAVRSSASDDSTTLPLDATLPKNPTPPPASGGSSAVPSGVPVDEDTPFPGGSGPRLSPAVPRPGPLPSETAPSPNPARVAGWQRPGSAPQSPGPAVSKNLREAYPGIQQLPPSPTRPQLPARNASALGTGAVLSLPRARLRRARRRRLALAAAIVLTIVAAGILAYC